MDMRSGMIGKWTAEGNSPLLTNKKPKKTKGEGITGIPIAREETRRKDAREEDRLPGDGQRCAISYRDRDHEVEVVNLSGGGAMIAAGLHPNIGDRLDLHLGEGGMVECVVRWVKEGRIGLEFAHETRLDCSDEERAALLWEAIDKAFPHRKSAAKRDEDTSDQRRATRHPLIWSAELHARSGSWRVRLRNVSDTGALIQCAKPLPVGREVILDLGNGGSVEATVTWAVGDHAGLRFDEEFDMRRLSRSKPQVAPARWLRPAYLENEVAEDSAWDEAWSRMSVEELKTELEGFLKR
jgi:PilZ domain-containing protein